MFVLSSRTDCYLIQGDLLTDALDNNFQHICQFLTDYSDGVSSSSFLSIHDTLAVGMLTHFWKVICSNYVCTPFVWTL